MMILFEALLAYLINLASDERSSAIAQARERKLKEALESEEVLRQALSSGRSLRDEVRSICMELARSRDRLGVTTEEEPLWRLLTDGAFQNDLSEWLMAGGIVEGNAVKDRLLGTMQVALTTGGANPERIAFLKTGYFEALEKLDFCPF